MRIVSSFSDCESQTHNNKSWSELLQNNLTNSRVRENTRERDGQVKERKERRRCQRGQVKVGDIYRRDFVK